MLRWAFVAAVIALVGISPVAEARELLWQTNASGNDIHVIDVESGKLIERLVVGPHPHGIGAPRDASTVFVSLERDGEPKGELLWIDPGSYAIRHRLQLGPEPHELAVTPGGRWVYVPCRDGHYWVVDAERREVSARIHTGGRPHNTTVSPDGRFMFLSPMGSPQAVTIVDVEEGHRVVGRIPFADSVRPPAISGDGARFFQQVDGLNGFQVADIHARRVIATIQHSTILGWFLLRPTRLGWLSSSGLKRCHGLAVRPDQAEIWSVCGDFLAIHTLENPRYPERALIQLPSKGYWLTFSPDSRLAFIALSESDEVAVVDARRRRVLRRVTVGEGPKRNLVVRTAP